MKYTDSHEWILVDGETGTVGITKHAQQELGEVVFVELPEIGREVKMGEEIAVLESTKAAADIYAPVSGIVVAVNQNLPALNQSPEAEGWLFKVALSKKSEVEQLLDKQEYFKLVQ